MTAMQVLDRFWNSFELLAYDETTVPDGTPFPYITYEASEDFFNHPVAASASLWYHSPSWAGITEKEREIANEIGLGGNVLPFDGGALWIKRGNPWAQRMDDPSDRLIRRIVLNIEIEFFNK